MTDAQLLARPGVHADLRELGATVAVAESLTGGLLSAALTATAGASNTVRGGLVVYATDLKATRSRVCRLIWLAERGAVDPGMSPLALAPRRADPSGCHLRPGHHRRGRGPIRRTASRSAPCSWQLPGRRTRGRRRAHVSVGSRAAIREKVSSRQLWMVLRKKGNAPTRLQRYVRWGGGERQSDERLSVPPGTVISSGDQLAGRIGEGGFAPWQCYDKW